MRRRGIVKSALGEANRQTEPAPLDSGSCPVVENPSREMQLRNHVVTTPIETMVSNFNSKLPGNFSTTNLDSSSADLCQMHSCLDEHHNAPSYCSLLNSTPLVQ